MERAKHSTLRWFGYDARKLNDESVHEYGIYDWCKRTTSSEMGGQSTAVYEKGERRMRGLEDVRAGLNGDICCVREKGEVLRNRCQILID